MGPLTEFLRAGAFAVALLGSVAYVNSPTEAPIQAALPKAQIAWLDKAPVDCAGKSALIGLAVSDEGGQRVGRVQRLVLSEDRSLCFLLLAPEQLRERFPSDLRLMVSANPP